MLVNSGIYGVLTTLVVKKDYSCGLSLYGRVGVGIKSFRKRNLLFI